MDRNTIFFGEDNPIAPEGVVRLRLRSGDLVRVKSGVHSGFVGRVQSMELYDMLCDGRENRIVLEVDCEPTETLDA